MSEEKSYFCFICGKVIKPEGGGFNTYKKHICTEHEEEKEWIACPYCVKDPYPTPVRDIRSHIKVKHKGKPIPKNQQLRVQVWKDWDPVKRQITNKKKYRRFKEGFHYSKKLETSIHYRSSWEQMVYSCLDTLDEVKSFRGEPFAIPYMLRGANYNYLPDLLVNFKDGRTELWEVKPSSQLNDEMNIAKWTAAKSYCEKRKWKFIVYTESGIKGLKRRARFEQETKALQQQGLVE